MRLGGMKSWGRVECGDWLSELGEGAADAEKDALGSEVNTGVVFIGEACEGGELAAEVFAADVSVEDELATADITGQLT